MPLEFGTCPCGGRYEQRAVEVRLTAAGRNVLLTDVPQGVCPMCGSRVYKRDDLQRIEALMKLRE